MTMFFKTIDLNVLQMNNIRKVSITHNKLLFVRRPAELLFSVNKIAELSKQNKGEQIMQHLFLAGFFAACGSFFGKLSGGEYGILFNYPFLQNIFIEQALIVLQGLFLFLMVICNVLNWRYFLKALQSTEQTLTATVMSAAANYIFSFLFGVFFFGETVSLVSLMGTTFIIIGLSFLCT